jgi:hypothetical protein
MIVSIRWLASDVAAVGEPVKDRRISAWLTIVLNALMMWWPADEQR